MFNPTVDRQARCKCCDGAASLFCVVDFHKNCEDRRRPSWPLAGIPIYYYRCGACGFLFSSDFDSFSPDDFRKHIYNDRYVEADPDFEKVRPESNARWVAGALPMARHAAILDYGGGNGLFARLLRAAGFARVTSYDPFMPEFAARPAGRFDLVLSFEVLEHSPTPRETVAELASFVTKPGMILFSTIVQPESVSANWWYLAPRNGHVSLHTRSSLNMLAQQCGLCFGSLGPGLHYMYHELPDFARALIAR